MTPKQIGSQIAIKSTLIGLVIAYLIMSILIGFDDGFSALLWITKIDFWPNLLLGVFGLISMGYLFGQRAGVEILEKNKNYSWIGIKYGFIILVTGTLIGSTLGFIEEGLDNIGTHENPFFDYYFKPLYWVLIFGTIPVLIVGFWFGKTIKKHG